MSKPTTIRLDDIREDLDLIKRKFHFEDVYGEDKATIKVAVKFLSSVLQSPFHTYLDVLISNITKEIWKKSRIKSKK